MKYRCPYCGSLNVPAPDMCLHQREKGIVCPDCKCWLRSLDDRPLKDQLKGLGSFVLLWLIVSFPTILIVFDWLTRPGFSWAFVWTPKGRGWFLVMLSIPMSFVLTAGLLFEIVGLLRCAVARQPIPVPEEIDLVQPETDTDTNSAPSELRQD